MVAGQDYEVSIIIAVRFFIGPALQLKNARSQKGVVQYCSMEWHIVSAIVNVGRFLSRVSTLTRDIDIAILSVRPSVCP